MRAVDIIRKKRDGHTLDQTEIEAFVTGATLRSWPDYQVSALLMAIVLRGMTPEETAWLTGAMVRSGVRLDLADLPGAKVDKHSTGGVGDKTSLILAPLAAACGLIVPMMSGRGLGHTGGTLDKLESIPGFRVGLTLEEFRVALRRVGCALIGQTAEIAPADKVLYALRDVTATVESIALISASIMSKKLAEGIDALVMDVKCGRGAFMKNRTDARRLAESLVAIGRANGVRTEALLSAMDAPLGRAVGNALEVTECLETLRGHGPSDLETLSVALAARMLRLGGAAQTDAEAEGKVRAALTSGRGLEKFREIISQQGGDARVVDDPRRLPSAPERTVFTASRSGYVSRLDAELVGRATMVLGAGRDRVEDVIDPAVGAMLLAKPGDAVRAGDGIVELHYRDPSRLATALELLSQACTIADEPPAAAELILETIR
ncbi:MAG TPA: thymidine phosphorylase [Gemmataceae bacterium]|nr:thymidine phosphorylase [Gemmataceae bacterium]